MIFVGGMRPVWSGSYKDWKYNFQQAANIEDFLVLSVLSLILYLFYWHYWYYQRFFKLYTCSCPKGKARVAFLWTLQADTQFTTVTVSKLSKEKSYLINWSCLPPLLLFFCIRLQDIRHLLWNKPEREFSPRWG